MIRRADLCVCTLSEARKTDEILVDSHVSRRAARFVREDVLLYEFARDRVQTTDLIRVQRVGAGWGGMGWVGGREIMIRSVA